MQSTNTVSSHSGLIPSETVLDKKKRGIIVADYEKEEFD